MKSIFQSAAPAVNSVRIGFKKLTSRSGEWFYGIYAWILFIVVMLIFGTLAILLWRPLWARPVARFGLRLLFRLAGMPISAGHIERLPSTPHILLVNHTSFLDGLALTALLPSRPGYAFVVRQQYRRQALLYPLLRAVGIVVLHGAHHGENIDGLAAALESGHNLVIFPEGGFAPEAGVKGFHTGAFVAAAKAKVPVSIAGLRGARAALRLGTWMPRRSAIRLEIGPTLRALDNDQSSLQQARRAARRAMLPLTGERDAAS